MPPLTALAELLLFALVVLALDRFVPSFDLQRIEPNPCWLPVLLLSVQYGTLSGLLAAAACIALSMQAGFPDQEVGENLFVYLLRAWSQPMLWIAAAVLLGQFRTRHIIERADLSEELAAVNSQRAAIAAYAVNLRKRCDLLERHLAGRDGSEPVAVLAMLASLGSGASADLNSSFAACIEAVVPGARASLLHLGRTTIETVATAPSGSPAAAVRLDLSSPLIREILASGSPISVLTREGERVLAGTAQIAVPVETTDGIGGVLLIHDTDPRSLTPALPAALSVVAAALAPALAAAAGQSPGISSSTIGQVAAPRNTQRWLERLWRPWQAPPTSVPTDHAPPEATSPATTSRRMVR